MKYALITDEQIQAIFQAMAYFSLGDDGKSTTGRHLSDEVFNIVKSLKLQEPVAYMHTCGSDIQINTLPAHCYGNNWTRTPLFAAPISEPVKERISEPVENLEAVAWIGYSPRDGRPEFSVDKPANSVLRDFKMQPLYTAPPITPDSATRSADSAESFCKQELHNLMSVAGRMALELECLLLDTKDLSVVSRWWDTGMESLQSYRDYIWSITHGKDGEHFCDTHCVHTDHHPDCELAQPEQEPVANEVQLNIIRWWPDGFANRLEHVWKDLIGFIPNYKLLDLQRMLAEFGFTMKIYEGEAPAISEPVENLESISRCKLCGGALPVTHALVRTGECDCLAQTDQ